MEHARYLECLAADFHRLRSVVAVDLDAAVPTCPGWTVGDLTRHVGEVYMHKTLAMREGAEPRQWPPPGLAGEEPLALLDRAYTALREELVTRNPRDPCGTWYTPDQTVGFWARRMALETVIHRIDAELGTQQAVAEAPTDLAVDGIDELLKVFIAFSVRAWGSYFTDVLGSSPGRSYRIRTDRAAWRVRTAPATFDVVDGDGSDNPDVTVSGTPTAVLRWVWNRESPHDPGVTIEGPPDAVAELKRCIATGTQ